jgi:hypothetical protein
MVECVECGKQLTIFNKYIHPVYGRNQLVCNHCFIRIDTLVEKWRNFVLTNIDYINSVDIDGRLIRNNFEQTVSSIMMNYYIKINNETSISYPTFQINQISNPS